MTTVTLRFQSTGQIPGDGRPVTLRGPSLTLGRGPGNDLVLPDPDRVVSSSHAVIENHNGNIVVIDLSSNGTFLNYGKIPLGRTPTPLNSGDILIIGPYELVVEMSRPQAMIADPLDEAPVGPGQAQRAAGYGNLLDTPDRGGDFLDDLLGGPPPTGHRQFAVGPEDTAGGDGGFDHLLGPAPDPAPPVSAGMAGEMNHSASDLYRAPRSGGGAIPDDWDDPLFAPPPSAAVAPAVGEFSLGSSGAAQADPFETADPDGPEPQADPFLAAPKPVPAEGPPVAAVAAPDAPAQVSTPAPGAAASGDAARAFLQALGVNDKVDDAELAETMARLGGVLRSMITGIREVLMTRTQFKGEFRLDQTMIAASGNNPLKFSITPEQAIEVLSRKQAKGYLTPQEATDQALNDIRAHEVAMIAGMEAALKGVLARLEPGLLEEKLDKQGGAGFFTNKRARYWDLYREMYASISDQAENQFHDLFAREFAAAYKSQLERLK